MVKALCIPFFVSCYLLFAQQNTGKNLSTEKLKQHAHSLKIFAKTQNCSTRLGLLIDMSIASRKNRFFVVDLQNDSVLVAGVCAHGAGNDVNREEVIFSNKPGSYYTSEGRYKLGAKFEGEYGTGYRLVGLDSTNSNALKRDIVLHYYFKVADEENANVVCRSNGCPMLSPRVFKAAEKLIDAESKPVLMWIYK
ncbi:MAG TPA: murein L,D-transpeptidase catalytic domain family protein [Bacteroidia bacterium]|jgi:hypothetical protein|nr:murein L,D-transpeptidase catalytic domain family protein [Bacteroidia bacterium]